MQRHVVEELPEVSERTAVEQLLVAAHPRRHRHIGLRRDENLAQSEGDSLAQLVLPGEGVREEMALHLIVRVIVALTRIDARCGPRLWPERQIRIILYRRAQLLI